MWTSLEPLFRPLRTAFSIGQAWGLLCKTAADTPAKSYGLSGRLYLSKSGWLLLSVPNALMRGLFDSLDEPGAELPYHEDGSLNAHISVVRPEELETIGGPNVVTERGHTFHYTLGPLKTVRPAGWDEMSRVWFVEVDSPELRSLRRSYGLSPLPNDNKFQFHITVAVRRKHVLGTNEVSKAAELEKTADFRELVSLLADPMIQGWADHHGLYWPGFQGPRNLYDRIEAQQRRAGLLETMRGAVNADRERYVDLLHALHRAAGGATTPATEGIIGKMADDVASVAPYMMVAAPKLWDTLHGSRGSSAALAAGLYRAGEGMVDPVTGQLGLSPEHAAQMAQDIYHSWDPKASRGFSAGELGELYQELVKRGQGAPPIDAATVAKSLYSAAGPVSAMRDRLARNDQVVGGVPDLMSALDQAVPGGFGVHPPQRIEQMLRQQTYLQPPGSAYGTLDQMGSEAYGAAARALGTAGQPGGLPLAELQAQDQQLRQQAASSPAANMLGASARLGQPYQPAASYTAWLQQMEQAGIPREQASSLFFQTTANQEAMAEPAAVNAIRQQQGPELHSWLQQQAGGDQGQQTELARRLGYGNLTQLGQLHGPAVGQATANLDQAAQEAAQQTAASTQSLQPARQAVDAFGSLFGSR